MSKESNIEEYLIRRISSADKKINILKERHGETPNKTHTYFGGWDLGYWEGMKSAYENIEDKIQKSNK